MRRMRTFLAAALLGLTIATGAYAAEISVTWLDWDPSSRSERRALAQKWLAAFQELDAQIPTLSPAETEWLSEEYDRELERSGRRWTRRALAAHGSIEFKKRAAKQRTADIIQLLEAILESNNVKGEVSFWVLLSTAVLDFEFWNATSGLVEAGVIGKEINGADSFYFQNHVTWVNQQILTQIVLPHLQGELPE